MTKWQPIKSAPPDIPILVTDGKSLHLATLKTNWIYSAPPAVLHGIAGGLAQAASNQFIVKPFAPTHWSATPKLPRSS